MACCGKSSRRKYVQDPMGGYKYLKAHQIKARLEVYKRRNCGGCDKRYACDYAMFLGCKGKAPQLA